MTNTKGKRRAPATCSLGLLESMALFLWLHTCESTRRVILYISREWVLIKKECPTNVTMAKLWECSVTQHAVSIIVNKQVKGKILAKRINVRIEHIKHSKSWNSFLKRVKWSEKASLLHPEKHTLWGLMERNQTVRAHSLWIHGLKGVKIKTWTVQKKKRKTTIPVLQLK